MYFTFDHAHLFPRQMSDIVGFDLKPQPTTPLSKMIEYGLDKQLEKYTTIKTTCTVNTLCVYTCTCTCICLMYIRLEDIGASASKEYSLEKAMEKMKAEWSTQVFGFVNHRDTVSVLG